VGVKRIGIVGGASPESTVEYYRRITHEYTRRFGDQGYPEVLIYSVSFQRFIDWMRAGDWRALAGGVADGLIALASGGAELGLIATNTFHRVYDEVAASSPIPLVSILDVVAARLVALGCRRAALLGTKITMSSAFYPERLSREGVATLLPTAGEQDLIDRVIFDELTYGRLAPSSKEALCAIARRLIGEGADAVILGCTELPLLLGPEDLPVPVLDTTRLHADAALEAALA
jgi:aspartate racemase